MQHVPHGLRFGSGKAHGGRALPCDGSHGSQSTGHTCVQRPFKGSIRPRVLLACTSTGAILFHAPGRAVTAPVAPAPVTRKLPRDGRPSARHLFSSQTEFQTRPFRDIRPPHQARPARDALSEKVRTGYGRSQGAGISFCPGCRKVLNGAQLSSRQRTNLVAACNWYRWNSSRRLIVSLTCDSVMRRPFRSNRLDILPERLAFF